MKAKRDIIVITIITVIAFILFFQFSKITKDKPDIIAQSPDSSDNVRVKEYEFGIPLKYYIKITGKIKPDQNLSTLLNTKGISLSVIDKLWKNSEKIFDLRKIIEGHNYILYFKNDSLETPSYFIYESNPAKFIVFNLRPPFDVSVINKKIDIKRKLTTGVIKSSLWNTMIENNLSPLLAMSLEDIYQWTIDFFGIQPGDKFRMIYEEKFVDGKSIGADKINAAEIIHMELQYYAIPYSQENNEHFYDADGRSLRRAFLKAPLKYSHISSGFSNSRLHPILKIRRPHHGIDYVAPRGTPVRSVGNGIVSEIGYQRNGGGRYVKIRHINSYSTTYMHLESIKKGIKKGVQVKQGQEIAYVGSSGLSTGPHLDFRFYKNGTPVNPLNIKAPPAKAIPDSKKDDFIYIRDSIIKQLETIVF